MEFGWSVHFSNMNVTKCNKRWPVMFEKGHFHITYINTYTFFGIFKYNNCGILQKWFCCPFWESYKKSSGLPGQISQTMVYHALVFGWIPKYWVFGKYYSPNTTIQKLFLTLGSFSKLREWFVWFLVRFEYWNHKLCE